MIAPNLGDVSKGIVVAVVIPILPEARDRCVAECDTSEQKARDARQRAWERQRDFHIGRVRACDEAGGIAGNRSVAVDVSTVNQQRRCRGQSETPQVALSRRVGFGRGNGGQSSTGEQSTRFNGRDHVVLIAERQRKLLADCVVQSHELLPRVEDVAHLTE